MSRPASDKTISPQDLLRRCADAIGPAGNNSITLVHPPGTGRFPFRGPGVELLSEVEGRGRVYAVDVEIVLRWMARHIASARAARTARYEEGDSRAKLMSEGEKHGRS